MSSLSLAPTPATSVATAFRRLAMAAAAFGLGAALTPGPARAQDGGRHLTLLGIPSATTAPHGSAFASLSYGTKREGVDKDDDDGSLALGVGLGDANVNFGLQFTAQITSLTDSFADSGYFGLKGARQVRGGASPLYAAVSVDRIFPWGDSEENDTSLDLMLTGFTGVPVGSGTPLPVIFTLGAGTHVRDTRTEPGLYAGIGLGLSDSFAASASYYGDYATFGMSYAPSGNQNLSVTVSLVDAFDQQDDQRAVISLNWLMPKAFGR